MTGSSLMLNSVRRLIFGPCINHSLSQSYFRFASSVPESASAISEDEELDSLYRKIDVEIRGYYPGVLKSYSWFATTAAKELGIKVGECWAPRKAHHNRLTLLKSVFVHKKHRVQYEIRTYYRHMEFLQLTGSTADTFLEYIQRNLPEGVSMIVTKTKLETLPEHITSEINKSVSKVGLSSS